MTNWGIDVEGRTMKYEAWPLDLAARYRSPNQLEREKTFGVKGEALAETLSYFESLGGDTDRLITMLNDHVFDNRFILCRAELMDQERWYTNEYYFYFIMFTKKIIGRYDFHFGEGKNDQLSIFHRIYEKGFLTFPPYSENEKENDTTNAIPSTFLLAITEHTDSREDILNWVEILVSEKGVISFKNEVSKIETYWLRTEFICYFYEFTRILLNFESMADVVILAYMNYKLKFLTLVPNTIFISSVESIIKKTSTLYDFKVTIEHSKMHIDATWVKKNNVSFFIYKKSIQDIGNRVFLGGMLMIIKVKTGMKPLPKVEMYTPIGGDHFAFNVTIPPKSTFAIPLLTFFTSTIFLALRFYKGFSVIPFIWVVLFLCAINALIIALNALLKAWRENKLLINNAEVTASETEKNIVELQEMASALLSEKLGLAEKVKQRTTEIEGANRKLKDYDKAKTEFFYNISHELRTPLAMIRSPIEAILSGKRGKSVSSDDLYFKIVLRNADKLLRHVNNLLDFAKIEQGRSDSNPRAIDIGALCAFFCTDLESVATTRGIILRITLPEVPAIIFIDPELFEKAFFNLASNALKFTSSGGIVNVSVERMDERIDIIVKDTGIGIPQDKLTLIFERFTQLDSGSDRRYEGTGLGLPLVKEIATLMGATVTVTSELGQGSEFKLSFQDPGILVPDDLWKAERHKVPEYLLADMRPSAETTKMDRGDLHGSILLVEDNDDLVAFLAPLIEQRYRLTIASNGSVALDILTKSANGIDLVVSDIMMPVMDGREFYRRCRESDIKIPFLYLTARASQTEKIEAIKEGVIDYIYKPFSVDELLSKVDSMIGLASDIKSEATRSLESRVLKAIREEPEPSRRMSVESIGLTARELEVAAILLTGESDKAISKKLGIAVKTASSHVSAILEKAGVQSRMEFIALFR